MASADDSIKSESETDNSSNICKVIIIGGGMAGIAAAFHLNKHGENDLKVLESRNRTGGRIVSLEMGGSNVELGAKWIHGVLGNPIYDLAIKNGLIRMNCETENHAVVATTEDGKRIPIKIVEEIYAAYFWFCKRCEEYFLLKLDPPDPAENSVGKHLEMDISAYLSEHGGEEKIIRRMIFDHLLNRETCITGCSSMHETGLKDFGSYTELPGGNINIPSKYSLIVDSLIRDLPENCVYKNHRVVNVKWNNGVEEEEASLPPPGGGELKLVQNEEFRDVPEAQVRVECANGKTFYARHVIVTLPLGVLKDKAREIFDPPLPDYKIESIERLCFGVVNKIYLEYDRPFLNPNISEIITLWGKGAPSSDGEASAELASNWFRKIYSFSKVSENVLLAWISGKEADYVETLSDQEIADTCTNALRKFLCDPYIPRPCRVICTKWSRDIHSRGSYTSIGINGTHRDIELLGNAIYVHPYHNKPVLLFAGEATHPSFYSTVHGAYLSGQRASEMLLDCQEGEPNSTSLTAFAHTGHHTSDLSSWLKGIDLE